MKLADTDKAALSSSGEGFHLDTLDKLRINSVEKLAYLPPTFADIHKRFRACEESDALS